MQRLNLNSDTWEEVRHRVVEKLHEGAVIAAPTETVYGILTRWSNTSGRERIFDLKERPRKKELQMLAPDLDTAIRFGAVSTPSLEAISGAFWPGPLTAVIADEQGGTIGLRQPDTPFLMDVLADLAEPVAATSANKSGSPPAYTADQAVAGLNGEPDELVDGGEVAGQPSTVISLLEDEVQLLREGPIAFAELKQAIHSDSVEQEVN